MIKLPKLRILVIAAILASLTVFSLLAQNSSSSASIRQKPIVASITKQTYRGLPVRLIIPAIDVNATIEYVGNNALGEMDTTKGSSNVAWYKYSALPGDLGSAVIAGHVVGLNGQSGVFIDLAKLQEGDTISVVDAKGLSASFTVRLSQIYNPNQTGDNIFNSTGGAHLNLITCAGEWDPAAHHYLNRLVVFADKSS